MNTAKKHNPGDTICTCRVGEDRYEVKREGKMCGAYREECAFLWNDEDCPSKLMQLCYNHNVYFIKIESN